MDSDASFSLFDALPKDVQFMIWEEALSATTVCAIVRKAKSSSDGGAQGEQQYMLQVRFIGPAPHVLGRVCRNARQQLEHSFERASTRGTRGLFPFAGARHWLNLERSIFYLGDGSGSRNVLGQLSDSDLARLRVVAFRWPHWDTLARTCICIAKRCPNIHTLIVQRSRHIDHMLPMPGLEESEAISRRDNLSLKTAACFARLPGYTGPEMQDAQLDSDYYRDILKLYFGDTPPTVHMLPHGEVELSGLQRR